MPLRLRLGCFFISCALVPLFALDSAPANPAPPPPGFGATAVPSTAEAQGLAAASLRYTSPDWVPTWSDDFETPGRPDPAKWTYEHGLVRNGEAQFYTRDRAENARVADGHLIITARKDPWEKSSYTSASLTTLDRFSFTCGKLEIRARVPKGRGTWPALWTLGANQNGPGWPACGEIDLMEYVGMIPDRLHFTVHTRAFNHTKGTQKGSNFTLAEPWKEFHRYGLIWTPERLEWFFDGQLVFSFANTGKGPDEWPFDSPQYLLMNLAIGGGWGGQKGIDDALFPAEFRIDYVRVWQRP